MNPSVCAVVVALLTIPSVLNGQLYSFSEGTGSFYALRHNKPGSAPYLEVIGSGIAINRAKRQAREGGYTLDVKGPFGGFKEATTFIRKEWDTSFGAPRKPTYGHPSVGHGDGKRDDGDTP